MPPTSQSLQAALAVIHNTIAPLAANSLIKMIINAAGREGVGRFTGLPLWEAWREKGGYLRIMPLLTSADGFCLSRYRRWEKGFCRLMYTV
jgi:hypothetical protein